MVAYSVVAQIVFRALNMGQSHTRGKNSGRSRGAVFRPDAYDTPCHNAGAVMSEDLQVVYDVVTGEFSYRHALRERPATKLLVPPTLTEIPASVLCSRQECRHDI